MKPPKKNKHVPHIKPKGVVIGTPVVAMPSEPESKEEGTDFAYDDYNPLSSGALEVTFNEGKMLAMALKASMGTTLEEQAFRKVTDSSEDLSDSSGNVCCHRLLDNMHSRMLDILVIPSRFGLGKSSGAASAIPEEVVATSNLSLELGIAFLSFPSLSLGLSNPSDAVLGFLLQKVHVTTLLSIAQGHTERSYFYSCINLFMNCGLLTHFIRFVYLSSDT